MGMRLCDGQKKATCEGGFFHPQKNYFLAGSAAAGAAAGAEASAAGAEAAGAAGAAAGAGAAGAASSFLPQAARAAAAMTAARTRVLFMLSYLKNKKQFPEIVSADTALTKQNGSSASHLALNYMGKKAHYKNSPKI
jgi:hypothetical protein